MAKASESRSFGLSAADTKALQAEYAETKKFPNPYRTGVYRFTVDALVSLGVNKPHPLAKAHEAFKRVAGDEWYAEWAGKERRNEKTGKDADGRFLQNLKVLQRTKDYGLKLLMVGRRVLKTKGAVIDLARDRRGAILVALNTSAAKPAKAGRQPGGPGAPSAAKPKATSRKRSRNNNRSRPQQASDAGLSASETPADVG